MPRVAVIPDDTPNAFATGRNPDHAVVAVTEGILRTLNRGELEGVLAHELAHVKNRDILVGSLAAVMAQAIMFISHMAGASAFFCQAGIFGGSATLSGMMKWIMSCAASEAARRGRHSSK